MLPLFTGPKGMLCGANDAVGVVLVTPTPVTASTSGWVEMAEVTVIVPVVGLRGVLSAFGWKVTFTVQKPFAGMGLVGLGGPVQSSLSLNWLLAVTLAIAMGALVVL